MTQFKLLLIIFAVCAPYLSTGMYLDKGVSFLAVQGSRLDPTTLTPRLPEYYGQGYNIFSGNPLGPEIDPGFSTRQVFDLKYSPDHATYDGLFYYPKEVSTTTTISCSYNSKSQEITGMQSYHKSLEEKVTVSAGGGFAFGSVSFTSSFGYQETQNQVKNQHNVAVLTVANCQLYEASLQATQELSQDFKDSVKVAKQKGDWTQFIDDWGTHYGHKIVLGASVVQKTTLSQQGYQMLRSSNVDVSVAVNAKFMAAHGGGSTSTALSSSQEQTFNQVDKNIVEYYVGQQPPKDGDARTWLSTVQQNTYPAPLSFTLRYIGDLFTTEYFKDIYSEEELMHMKEGFDTKVKAIAETKPHVPINDEPIPQPKLLEAETMVVGGSGGNLYRDEPIRDISLKAGGVKYKSGNVLDGISLIFTNFQESAWHGGQGGNFQTLDFGSNRVSKVKVWINNGGVVSGMMFIYETGGVSQAIGQKNGAMYELPIYGNLVGIKGRGGQYLDSIGFVSNVISTNPASPITVPVYSDFFGGFGGNHFDSTAGKDISTLTVNSFVIRSGSRIDGIQIDTSAGRSQLYGGKGGNEDRVNLANLSAIEVWADGTVNGIRVITNSGSSRVWGNQWGNYNKVKVPSNSRLVGIYGRSGNILDRIGFVFARTG